MSTFSLALSFGAAKERAFTSRRVYKKDVVNSVTTEILYLHDGMNAIVERNKTGTPTEYIYGPTGIIAIKTTSSMNYVIKDHLGSTRVMINTTDLPYALTTYDYSAFGTILTTPSSTAYLYTGQEWDQTSGLHNFKARMYDSDLAMFYGADPAGQGSSPFAYVGNNPVIRSDKDGKVFFLAPLLVGAAVGALTSSAVYTTTALTTGNFEWKNLGKAAAFGAVGGAISGGVGAIGTGLGSFGQSAAFNILSNTASYAGTTAAFGGKITAGGLAGAVVGGAIGGAIPGFSGTNSNNALVNIGAELAHGAAKGTVVGGLSGAVGAAIDGRNPGQGFTQGLKYGAVGGATMSALQIAAFGHAIRPDPLKNKRAVEALNALERDRVTEGVGIGNYKPVYRSGGLYGWFHSKVLGSPGIAFGRNLLILSDDDGTRSDFVFVHETEHYYQQIRQGFGNYLWKGAAEQWFMNNPYGTPGTNDVFINSNRTNFRFKS